MPSYRFVCRSTGRKTAQNMQEQKEDSRMTRISTFQDNHFSFFEPIDRNRAETKTYILQADGRDLISFEATSEGCVNSVASLRFDTRVMQDRLFVSIPQVRIRTDVLRMLLDE